MPYEFKRVFQVEFADTDMAGIVHFANFFRYMEATEHGWPRVHVTCDYKSPLRFEDEVEVHLRVREKRSKSLTYDFTFRKLDGTPVATGALTAVCVALDEQTGTMKAVAIPEAIAAKIEVAPNE